MVGEIVAALHEDQRFYRARIIDYDEDSIELHSDLRKDQRAKVGLFFKNCSMAAAVDDEYLPYRFFSSIMAEAPMWILQIFAPLIQTT